MCISCLFIRTYGCIELSLIFQIISEILVKFWYDSITSPRPTVLDSVVLVAFQADVEKIGEVCCLFAHPVDGEHHGHVPAPRIGPYHRYLVQHPGQPQASHQNHGNERRKSGIAHLGRRKIERYGIGILVNLT